MATTKRTRAPITPPTLPAMTLSRAEYVSMGASVGLREGETVGTEEVVMKVCVTPLICTVSPETLTNTAGRVVESRGMDEETLEAVTWFGMTKIVSTTTPEVSILLRTRKAAAVMAKLINSASSTPREKARDCFNSSFKRDVTSVEAMPPRVKVISCTWNAGAGLSVVLEVEIGDGREEGRRVGWRLGRPVGWLEG
jgi:hypothetical protein